MEYDLKKIGPRIREIRKNTINKATGKAYTQADVVAECPISNTYLSKLENGEDITLSLQTLIKLCSIFDCDIGYLLGEYDTKKREIADIQNMIGLSEDAICMLKELSELQTFDHILEMLSSFITDCSSDQLNTMCTIAGHSESIEKAEWERDHIHHSDFEYEKQKGADLYIIQNAFMDFIKRYIDIIRKERKEQWQT